MTDLVPCPMPRERTPYARLIEAAAQIARLTNMPDVDQWRWSSSASQRLYRDAKMAEGQAENQCGEWAQAIRIAADKMRAELAHARADIERLSVDLAEAQREIERQRFSVEWNRSRLDRLQKEQARIPDPWRTLVCDILANGSLLPDPEGTRYGP